MPKSQGFYIKCKNCKKTDVKFSSEGKEKLWPYLKNWHEKIEGVTGLVAHSTR